MTYALGEPAAAKAGPIPFLKWAGGKRWLTEDHLKLFPIRYKRYFEPFLGSGAVFFKLRPSAAILSDANAELIATYEAVRDIPGLVKAKIGIHHSAHSTDYYYDVRSAKPRSRSSRASRFIYLNRVCYNGLYRVNLNGGFNVPIGTKKNVSLPTDNFNAVSELLRLTTLLHSDFEPVIDLAGQNDFIYADPPYTVKHDNNGFIKYNENIFSWSDQIRLRDALVRASARGALIMISNANHVSIKQLYEDFGGMLTIERSSVISGLKKGRNVAAELVIRNYSDD